MRAWKILPQFRSQGWGSFLPRPPPPPNPETLTSTCQLHPLGLSQQSLTFQAFVPDIIPFDLYNLPLKWRGQVSLLPFYEWGNGDHKHRVKPWAAKTASLPLHPGERIFLSCLRNHSFLPTGIYWKIIKKVFRHLSAAYHKARSPVPICLGHANQVLHQPNKILLER